MEDGHQGCTLRFGQLPSVYKKTPLGTFRGSVAIFTIADINETPAVHRNKKQLGFSDGWAV